MLRILRLGFFFEDIPVVEGQIIFWQYEPSFRYNLL